MSVLRRKLAGTFASAVMALGLLAPAAGAQPERIVAPEERDDYVAEFVVDADNPPVVDGVGALTEAEIAEYQEKIRQAEASGPPQDEIIPGQMWSDKVGLPEGVDKAEADQAEVAIAREQSQPLTMILQATSTRCRTFWPSWYQVCGSILDRYEQLGANLSWLLLPVEPMGPNPDGQGQRQRFVGGFIYWHPDTGAHAVSPMTASVWERHGWEAGWLGYPLGGEVPVQGSNPVDGEINGWVQLFQGGRVYRTPVLEGFQVASINGLILDRWLELGGPNSDLGFPIADEVKTADGVGRFSVFQNGSIYWHPDHGAWEVSGEVEKIWMTSGETEGLYGYPVGGLMSGTEGTWQPYEEGEIYLPSQGNAKSYRCREVINEILDRVGPLTDKEVSFYCDDQGGSISWEGGDFHFLAPSREMLVEPQVSANVMMLSTMECNDVGFTDASPPLRLSDYSVRKVVETCVGQVEDRIPLWSKEFAYSIKHTLTQRRFHEVELTINSLGFPGRVFTQNYDLKEDRRFAPDPTLEELQTTNIGTSTSPSIARGDLPEERGTYYVEATDFHLSIPSLNYSHGVSKWNGARLKIGRFECQPFDPDGSNEVCRFGNPVNDA